MNLKNLQLWRNSSLILEEMFQGIRNYSTKSNRAEVLRKLRPMIMKRIEERAKDYPVNPMLPVAREVLHARNTLYHGVSTLIQHVPVWACKQCTEVYISEDGHLIRTCPGNQHDAKRKVHDWVKGSMNDILVPIDTLHLQKMFQNVIEHHERSNHERIPAVIELCMQAGADPNDQIVSSSVITQDGHENNTSVLESLSDDDLRSVATQTLMAWETLRCGVHHLLLAYPVRVCKECWEVHVGPSGHTAHTCGVLRRTHLWKKAGVDDLVPPKIVWYRRRQDPAILVDQGRDYYGHAPAVVDLCSKGGAIVPSKYYNSMKVDGLTFPL